MLAVSHLLSCARQGALLGAVETEGALIQGSIPICDANDITWTEERLCAGDWLPYHKFYGCCLVSDEKDPGDPVPFLGALL